MLENTLNEHASAWKGNEEQCCMRVISEEVSGGDIVILIIEQTHSGSVSNSMGIPLDAFKLDWIPFVSPFAYRRGSPLLSF